MKYYGSIYNNLVKHHNFTTTMNPNFKATIIRPKASYTVEEIARCLQADLVIFQDNILFDSGLATLGKVPSNELYSYAGGVSPEDMIGRPVGNIPTNWQKFKDSIFNFIGEANFVKISTEKDEKGKLIPSDSEEVHSMLVAAMEKYQTQFEGDFDRVADDWVDCCRIAFKAFYSLVEDSTPVCVPHEVDFEEDPTFQRSGNVYVDVMRLSKMGVYIKSQNDSENFLGLIEKAGITIKTLEDFTELEEKKDRAFLDYAYNTDPADLTVNLL